MFDVVTHTPRYHAVHPQKLDGVVYTPVVLAKFVVKQILSAAVFPEYGAIRVLDPAVGDGGLLDELLKQLPISIRTRLEVVGYDIDVDAIQTAEKRLKKSFPFLTIQLEQKDFLEHVLNLQGYGDLFSTRQVQAPFHLVIANPPYVRTQVMGARQSQQLAQNFGLSGRVDLYYPFLLAISHVLEKDGVVGVITSNRFMTTKSGQAVRRGLLSRFRVLHAWDMGDTKLFGAAILPAVLLARGTADAQQYHAEPIAYSSLYETKDSASATSCDALAALTHPDDTVVALPDKRHFRVRHGVLENGSDADAVWRIATQSTDKWLATVEQHTWGTFRRIGKVRVGVKSTADKVFIRNDWDHLPSGRPELLRPLTTRHCARRFKANLPAKRHHIKEILYPHESTEKGRGVVSLVHYPKSASYLEQHRERLESRSYVIAAGRKWYELWVAHDPAVWSAPKLVFPDIADKPIFWMDREGTVVNGECYWLRCENDNEQDLLWLALAVANSTFIEKFYDHRFNNKLYAGRRRFITQYVEQFPLPDPAGEYAKQLVEMAKTIYAKLPASETIALAENLNGLVWRAFGLTPKEISR